MNKLHIVQRADGSVLVVAVMNPGTPSDVAQRAAEKLKQELGERDRVLVVPYATAVVVTQHSLWQAVRAWWAARRVAKSEGGGL